MPSGRLCKIRNRSKSKCKHSYTHETERIYKPCHSCSPDWAYDTESDCGCDDCDPCSCKSRTGRGRSPYDLRIYVDGEGSPLQQNIDQQNIGVLPGCCGKSCHGHGEHRSRSRGRPIIVPNQAREPARHIGQPSRHHNGRCCTHGYSPFAACPQGCHLHRHHQFLMARNGYTYITNDDGKVEVYNNAKLLKKFTDFADAHAKAKKDKEDAEKKKQDDTADIINKLLKPAESAPRWTWPGEYKRSAEDIRSELERVNADMDQLHSWASLIATNTAACHEEEIQENQLAMCSGALQGNEEKENVLPVKRRQLKSVLVRPK